MIEDKVGYTDRQFRAFASVVALGASRSGEFKDRAALEHLLGPLADQVDFLIGARDLKRTGGRRLVVANWPTYQGAKPDPTAADRMRRLRDRQRAEAEADAAAGGAPEEVPGSLPGALDEVPESPPVPVRPLRRNDRHSRATAHLLSSSSPDQVPVTNGKETRAGANGHGNGNGYDLDAWVALRTEVDAITGGGINGLSSPYSTLGQRALELAASFGLDPTLAAFRDVATRTDHPDAGQVVLGARSILRPLISSSVSTKPMTEAERTAAEFRRDLQRRLEENPERQEKGAAR